MRLPRLKRSIFTLVFLVGLMCLVHLLLMRKLHSPRPSEQQLLLNRLKTFYKYHKLSRNFTFDTIYNLITSSQRCTPPELKLNSKDVLDFLRRDTKRTKREDCTQFESNWVETRNATFNISSAKLEETTKCYWTPVVRPPNQDFRVDFGQRQEIRHGETVPSDIGKVRCSSDGKLYKNYHSTIKRQSHPKTTETTQQFNVVMIGFDSVSRMNWMRNMRKSHAYFTQELGGVIMTGYNIVGDATLAALQPIFTGKRDFELPESRRGFPGAKVIDDQPWHWKDFKRQGYITHWSEDMQYISAFQMSLLGFEKQPVRHYMRPLYLALQKDGKSQQCLGSLSTLDNFMNLIEDLYTAYPKSPKFSFTFHSEFSHQDIYSNIKYADDSLFNFLASFKQEGHTKNTILILFSDHGSRYTAFRQVADGRIEERMPYVGIMVPKAFKDQFPQAYDNLVINSKRLTTPFDFHETLLDIAYASTRLKTAETESRGRGISFFSQISANRTCAEASVSMHWCACAVWVQLPVDSPQITAAANALINAINEKLADYKHLCATSRLDRILQGRVLSDNPEDALAIHQPESYLEFLRLADQTGDNDIIHYLILVVIEPGRGLIDATITYRTKQRKFDIDFTQLNRINVYGRSANCIKTTKPALRGFCYCK